MNNKWVISLPAIKVHAFHGIHDFEKEKGNDFVVSLRVVPEIEKGFAQTLDSTIDYEHLYRIVKEEMQIPAGLMEEVAKRIAERIMSEQPTCNEVELSISKLFPETMPGCNEAMVTLTLSR